jgi:hypothetical protein
VKVRDDGKYKGYVIDPRKGRVYDAVLWRDHENLILRGELWIFGKNTTWPPFPEENFNESFPKPDLSSLIPYFPYTQ